MEGPSVEETPGVYNWTVQEDNPRITWRRFMEWLRQQKRLREIEDIPNLGEFSGVYSENGYVFLCAASGDVVITHIGDSARKIEDPRRLQAAGLITEETCNEMLAQIKKATACREAGQRAKEEEAARRLVREACLVHAVTELRRFAQSADSTYKVLRIEDLADQAERAKKHLGEIVRVCALSDEQCFQELLDDTISRVKRGFGDDPAENRRLAMLLEVKDFLGLKAYFDHWER